MVKHRGLLWRSRDRGGKPLESCARSRTTPDAGTLTSTHDDTRHRDIVATNLHPTGSNYPIDSMPTHPVQFLLKLVVVEGQGKLIK